MARSFPLFTVLGTRVSLHYTWFIVLVLFAWSLAYGYFPANLPGLSKGAYIVMGSFSALALFICVLIHELAHSYVSNRLGLPVKEITLFIFGGVAHLTREPDKAADELKIAVAGPAASLVLAAFFYVFKIALVSAGAPPEITGMAGFLFTANIVLLIFNLIPGFPLDGGRVLRAIWWQRTGNVRAATKASSTVGRGFAFALIALGFVELISGLFVQGLWAILIGMFLQQAAEGSYRQLVMKLALEGIRVADIMTRNVVSIDGSITVTEAVERYFFAYHHAAFPVTGPYGVIGMIGLRNVRSIEKDKWATTLVSEAADPLTVSMIAAPNDTVLSLLTRMASDGSGRHIVMENNAMVGVISRSDIFKAMEIRAEFEK
ncbi:MAG: site-2 protease family protein [Deltaproteobacteria bacterium]|nr:site-2 protease family protein [Deltaproteobacteria bacterium]